MSGEPKTRETSRRELARMLQDSLREPPSLSASVIVQAAHAVASDEPPTIVYERRRPPPEAPRPSRAPARTQEPRTAIGLGNTPRTLRLDERDRGVEGPRVRATQPRDASAPAPSRRYLVLMSVVLLAIVGCVVGASLWTGAAPPARVALPPPLPATALPLPPVGESSAIEKEVARELPIRVAPAEAVGEDGTSERRAVALLMAGERRAALAAYRTLAQRAPTPAVVEVARLLERELSACQEGSPPCP